MKRICASVIALTGWFALGVQLYLTLEAARMRGAPMGAGLDSYFSFFTIWTNTLAASLLTLAALRPGSRGFWNRPAAGGAVTVYIIVVALVYAAVLQGLWKPRGLSLLADGLLHRAIPSLFVAYWLLLVKKGGLRWIDPLFWPIFPLGYMAYALARGAISGVYPYPFLNVARLGYDRVFVNGLILLALFIGLGLLLVAIDRALGRLLPSGAGRHRGRL